MFWSRTNREERRQKVLDGLLALEPDERRAHLELAVMAGDVRANEVEETLRLARRLDGLRFITLSPASQPGPGKTFSEDALDPDAPSMPAASKVRKVRVPAVRSTAPGARDRASMRTVADHGPDRFPAVSSALTVALAAAQLVDGDSAGRGSRTGSFSSRQRRLRQLAAADRWSADTPMLSSESPESRAHDDRGEPKVPDISWLRP